MERPYTTSQVFLYCLAYLAGREAGAHPAGDVDNCRVSVSKMYIHLFDICDISVGFLAC